MKTIFSIGFALILLFVSTSINAQEIHTQANAASIDNESNTTTGWTGNATASSDTSEFYSGSYCLKFEAPFDGWYNAKYVFSTTPGEQYEIRVFAKSSSPTGPGFYFIGFNENSSIGIGSEWTEYTTIRTASGTDATIRVYTGVPAVAGNSVYIDHVSITPVDTQDPTPPTLSSTGQSNTSIDLSWSGATDNVGVTNYKVYRDNTLIETIGNVSTYQMTGLTPGTSYAFAIRALDAAGNQSTASNITASTTNSSDTQSPSAPTLSSSGNTDTTADLSWSGATDNVGVTGYKIFKDGVLEATLGSVGAYTATGLTASTTYSFTATALDAVGNESSTSNSVSVTTNASSGGGSSGGSVWSESNSVASYTGDVAIGTSSVPAGYKMAIDGKLITEEVQVQLSGNWPDYVFEEGYDLPSLEEIQKHIEEKGHLPNIPSADEVKTNGIELGEMNRLLLEKIEELTLYVIQLENQQKNVRILEERLNLIEKRLNKK